MTPEMYRKKKGNTNRMSDPSIETMNKESEYQSETETTGLCGGRRYLSDLDSLDPNTGFPTKWMSDHSDYDSEATVGDNKRNYQDKSDTGNVRVINIEEDREILRERLLAEKTEKQVLEAAIAQRIAVMENKIQGECGLQYWKKGQTEQLLNSVCCKNKYVCTRKHIQETLGFGKDHDVLPVYKSGGMYGAKLRRFRCVTQIFLFLRSCMSSK